MFCLPLPVMSMMTVRVPLWMHALGAAERAVSSLRAEPQFQQDFKRLHGHGVPIPGVFLFGENPPCALRHDYTPVHACKFKT
jgi:hypothetical protein